MGRKKERACKFPIEISEKDNNLLESLADKHDVSKKEILRRGLYLYAEATKVKEAGEKLLVGGNGDPRELLLLFF